MTSARAAQPRHLFAPTTCYPKSTRSATSHFAGKVSRLAAVNDPFELAALNCMKRERRAALKQFNERQNSRVGMRCFCEHRKGSGHVVTLRRQSSWHCLGFDLDPALGAGGLQKVHYVAAKLDLVGDLADTDTLPPDIEARLLVTKFANWAYERERRSFLDLSSLNQDDGDYFLPFGAQIRLTEVILGAQCPSATL
jgi:hypothetical protein